MSNQSLAYPYLLQLQERAKACGAIRVAVAYPCDASSLKSVMAAVQSGLIQALLVGPQSRIKAVADQHEIDLSAMRIIDTPDVPRVAAAQAAALCRDGEAQALMKGSLHSDDLLGAAVSKESGLRGGRRASHVFVFDIPDFGRPLLLSDCVVNIEPTLMAKRDIVQSAIDLAQRLGIAQPKVAILSAVETVNPAIASTLDAAALCKMADRKQIEGGILDGPLAYDNAISLESARNKGIESAVAGQPDILLLPNLEAGNMLYKQLVYMAGAECAGLVLGLKVPVILTSRSDSVLSRVTSCALAVLHTQTS